MSDLISRQALCEYALNQKDKSVTPNDIMRFPSAQPEPCEDAVSRKDVIAEIKEIYDWHDTVTENRIIEHMKNLPSAQPDLEEAYQHGVTEAEARFNAERKKGEWIEHNPHTWGLGIVFECSECGEKIECEPSNFCPNCGADMREGR